MIYYNAYVTKTSGSGGLQQGGQEGQSRSPRKN